METEWITEFDKLPENVQAAINDYRSSCGVTQFRARPDGKVWELEFVTAKYECYKRLV